MNCGSLARGFSNIIGHTEVIDFYPWITLESADKEFFFKRVQMFSHNSFFFGVEAD